MYMYNSDAYNALYILHVIWCAFKLVMHMHVYMYMYVHLQMYMSVCEDGNHVHVHYVCDSVSLSDSAEGGALSADMLLP